MTADSRSTTRTMPHTMEAIREPGVAEVTSSPRRARTYRTMAAVTATTMSAQMLLRTAVATSSVDRVGVGPHATSGTVGTMATTNAMKPEKSRRTSSSADRALFTMSSAPRANSAPTKTVRAGVK